MKTQILVIALVVLAGLYSVRAQTQSPIPAEPATLAPRYDIKTGRPPATAANAVDTAPPAQLLGPPKPPPEPILPSSGSTAQTPQPAASITYPPQTISVLLSAAPSPAATGITSSSEPTAWSQGHEPSTWSKFMDGTAAIFGVFSAALALAIAFLAIRGFSTYQDMLNKLQEEVVRRLEKDLDDRVTKPAIAKVQGEMDRVMSDKVRTAIELAEKKLTEELSRLSKDPGWTEYFTNEVLKRVQEQLHPPSQEISTSEFEEPQ